MRVAAWVATLLAVAALPGGARAASGVFFEADDASRVIARHTLVVLGDNQTVWWEQPIVQAGAGPYAVILPVKNAQAPFTSSDALFWNLDAAMDTDVQMPSTCTMGVSCFGEDIPPPSSFPDAQQAPGQNFLPASPTILPTEMLALADATAAKDWLAGHDLVVPTADAAMLDSYGAEGFSFIGVYMQPAGNVTRMRPVRVSLPAGVMSLPLRADAAGAGSQPTPQALFVIASTRVEPTNMPIWFVDTDQLVWDWGTRRSNLSELVAAGAVAAGDDAWLMNSSINMIPDGVPLQLITLALQNPGASGYGDANGVGAEVDAMLDTDLLKLPQPQARAVSLRASLPTSAFAQDLLLASAADQNIVPNLLVAPVETGTPPGCPFTCDAGPGGNPAFGETDGCSCRVGSARRHSPAVAFAALLALLMVVKRWGTRARSS